MWDLLVLIGSAVVVVNTLTTIGIVRSRAYDPDQKLLQVILVWLVPVIAAAVCGYVLMEERRVLRKGHGGSAGSGYDATQDSDHGYFDHGHHGDDGGDGH